MLIETGSRIENIQLELNSIEILFRFKIFIDSFPKKYNKTVLEKANLRNFKYFYGYYRNLEHIIPEIFFKLGFFHPVLYGTKSWVLFWLLNSIDLLYLNLKKNFWKKKINHGLIFLSKINLPQLFKNSNSSLFTLYSTLLCLTITSDKYVQFFGHYSIKPVYFFIKMLTKSSLLPRNSKISDCDSRNLFCIGTIASLLNIWTIDLENVCLEKINHISLTFEGFSTRRFGSAHGALTYCSLGSLFFFPKKNKEIEFSSNIIKWLKGRSHFFMFGFSGRISKIPDSCYNFWIGASLLFLNINLNRKLKNSVIFYTDYISKCFSDRSGKPADSYHICYSICGLAILNFLVLYENILKSSNLSLEKNYNCFCNLAKLNPVFSFLNFLPTSQIFFNKHKS